jgi:hypothetical protein
MSASCDCYAMFGQPHFHDCPAGIWQNVPAQYKQNRWAFDYDEKNSTFFVHSGGHRICDAEDSEVASAICNAFNISFLKG